MQVRPYQADADWKSCEEQMRVQLQVTIASSKPVLVHGICDLADRACAARLILLPMSDDRDLA